MNLNSNRRSHHRPLNHLPQFTRLCAYLFSWGIIHKPTTPPPITPPSYPSVSYPIPIPSHLKPQTPSLFTDFLPQRSPSSPPRHLSLILAQRSAVPRQRVFPFSSYHNFWDGDGGAHTANASGLTPFSISEMQILRVWRSRSAF